MERSKQFDLMSVRTKQTGPLNIKSDVAITIVSMPVIFSTKPTSETFGIRSEIKINDKKIVNFGSLLSILQRLDA